MPQPVHCNKEPKDDYTHMGTYRGTDSAEMTHGKEYNLIYESMSDTVTFKNDLNIWCYLDGDCFQVTHNYGASPRGKGRKRRSATALDDRPIAPQPVFDMDDMVTTDWDDDEANDAACNTHGIEAIARDVVPEPEGPKSTEELRQHRYTPNLY